MYDGVSPAWPISYGDLESYYTQAENLYQVHGTRGEDPTDPGSSSPFPYPAISHEPRIQQLHDDLAAAGLKPFHTPLGVMLNESNMPESKCIRCDTCDGFPCLVHAKADAEVLCVDPALKYPNVTLLTEAYAKRLETSPSGGEVTKVIVERNGATEEYSADIVVSSCGAINSAALLLRSANDKHPTRACQWLRRRGPPLHGTCQFRDHGHFQVRQLDHLPEDAVDERFLFRYPGMELPHGAYLVRRQARRGDSEGRRSEAHPRLHARSDGQALARFLADLGRPAGSR